MDKQQPIYEIHIYEKPWTLTQYGFFEYGIEECVGFYYKKETAIRAVEENWLDLQDHYARAALVVEKLPGLYPLTPHDKCWYYLWNSTKECFEKTDFPGKDWWP